MNQNRTSRRAWVAGLCCIGGLLAAVVFCVVRIIADGGELASLRSTHESDQQAIADLQRRIALLDHRPDSAAGADAAPSRQPVDATTSNAPAGASAGDGPAMTARRQAQLEARMRSDIALRGELQRLDQRIQAAADPTDAALVQQLRQSLAALQAAYDKIDQATDPGQKQAAQQDLQHLRGDVIRLSQTDRNEQLARLAKDMGLTDEGQINQFIVNVDQVYRDSFVDWTRLSSRGTGP